MERLLQVLPGLPLRILIVGPQQVRRMIRHHDRYVIPFKPVAAHSGDPFLASEHRFRRCRAERADRLGPDRRQLAKQKLTANLHLIRFRGAIFGWPAFYDVADVHVASLERDSLLGRSVFNHLSQKLPGAADKGKTLNIFISAGTLPYEHEPGLLVSHPEYDLMAPGVQAAALAVADVLENL